MEKQKKIEWDWGIEAPLAPSAMRRRPIAGLGASLLAGAVVWTLSLAPLWAPLPLLADLPWPMERQLGCWTTALIRFKFDWVFRSWALGCSFGRENLGAARRLGADEHGLLPRVDLLRGSSPPPALRR